MDTIAAWPAEDRQALFQETANRRAINFSIIEKDFWVCWTLKHLFELPELEKHLIFKGGTSLSKVFNLIQRFSEDIDLAIDPHWLGFSGSRDPLQVTGNNKKQDLVKALSAKCAHYVEADLKPILETRFATILGQPGASENNWTITVETVSDGSRSLLFAYPPSDPEIATTDLAYIKPNVIMELGARADQWPSGKHLVKPYAAEVFPDVFKSPDSLVIALEPERTFWEKATILHAEHHRVATQPMPARLSRHYYDLFQLTNSWFAAKALSEPDLLDKVARHKSIFFKSAWAKYEEARIGTLRLVPPDYRLVALREDYEQMQEMIFDTPPSLDLILETLGQLERRINRL